MNVINILLNNIDFLDFSWRFLGDSDKTNATGILLDVVRIFCMWLCQIIYKGFAFFYQLFIILSKIRITNEIVEPFTRRITILLGLVMLFVSIFYLIKLLLNPDRINDKEAGIGNLVKRMIISVILIGFTPFIFETAYKIQDAVIESNIIAKILLSEDPGSYSEEEEYMKNYGRALESQIFRSFYKQKEGEWINSKGCPSYEYIHEEIMTNGTLNIASDCVNEKGKRYEESINMDKEINDYIIEYDALESVVVGIILLWMIIIYTIDVGVRTIQLIFLQIIAPIPIVSYIFPKKDGMFGKWVKQVTTTYLDLFIRVAIIYFILYLIRLLWDGEFIDSILGGLNLSDSILTWTKVVLTIAALIFAKRLPQLIQDLSGKPNAASLGFGIGKSNAAAGTLIGAATVGAMGFIGSTGAGRITGLAKGLIGGGLAGAGPNAAQNIDKTMKKAIRSNQIDERLKSQGYGFFGRIPQRMAIASGGISAGEKEHYAAQVYDQAKALIDDEDSMKDIKAWESQAQTYGIASLEKNLRENGSISDYGRRSDGSLVAVDETKTKNGIFYDKDNNQLSDVHSVLHDREGRVLHDFVKGKDGELTMDKFKEMSNREGNYIMNEPPNEAVVRALNRCGQIERRNRTGYSTPKNYKDLKTRGKEHKSNTINHPIPYGSTGMPK